MTLLTSSWDIYGPQHDLVENYRPSFDNSAILDPPPLSLLGLNLNISYMKRLCKVLASNQWVIIHLQLRTALTYKALPPSDLQTLLPLPEFFPNSQRTLPYSNHNKTPLRNGNCPITDPITQMGVCMQHIPWGNDLLVTNISQSYQVNLTPIPTPSLLSTNDQ